MTESFVGRTAQLTRLEEAFDAARGSRPGAVLVGGEPGIGKTRLAEVFAARARAAGATVLWSRAWDGGGAPPYWPVLQVLRSLGATLDDIELKEAAGDGASTIAGFVPEFGRRLRVEGPSAPPSRFVLFDAVSEMLHAAARKRPLVAIFDDLHGSDASTLELLRFTCRAFRTSQLLVIGTYRTVDTRADTETRQALAQLARETTNLPMAGLEASAVGEWVAAHGGPAELSAEIVRATAGNPLFIDGILRARHASPSFAGGTRVTLASEVRGAIALRVAATSEGARWLLDAVAVVGRPAALSLLARVLRVPFDTLLGPAGLAVEAGLLVETGELGQYRFYHPLVQEVTYDAIMPEARSSLHARAADALTELYGVESSAHLPELARHCLAAAPLGTGERAVSLCHAAGRRAVALAAFVEAGKHFSDARAAISYLPPGTTPPVPLETILTDLAESELAAGHVLSSRETFEEVVELARARRDAVALGTATLGFARTFEFGVVEPRRLALLEEAAAALEPHDSATLARVLARLAQELWMMAGRENSRAEIAERAIAMGERLEDDETTAFALNAWLQCVWGPEHQAKRLERADLLLRLADSLRSLERLLEAHRWRVNVAVEAGEIGRAESAIEDYAQVAEAMRRPDYLANAMMRKAMLPQLRGDLAKAEELAQRTRELQVRAGDPQADVVYVSRCILLYEETHRADAIGSLLPAMRDYVAARPRFVLYRAILIRGLLAAGDHDTARLEWERIWNSDLADVSRDMMLPATLALLVPPCIALGDRSRAERLHDLLAPFAVLHAAIGASYSLGSTARWVGLLAELLDRRAEATLALESALAMNERMGARAQVIETARDLSRVRGTIAETVPARPGADVVHSRLLAEGAVWLVEHGGKSARVRHSIGLSYLRELLDRPGVEMHVLDLARGVAGGTREEGRAPGDAGPALDARARASYQARIAELRDIISEAEGFSDRGRTERAKEELDQITAELGRAFGLGGRSRRTSSGVERARTSVTKAIARAIAAIDGELPDLGQHLARAIRTGIFCSYDPEPRARIDWHF